jgi:hypothetical protein
MHTHTTTIELEVEVDYSYTPEEPEIRYLPDGSGQPGYPAQAHINAVRIGDEDISYALPAKLLEELAEECVENHDDEP